MNKYDKHFYQNEKKYNNKSELKCTLLELKYFLKVISETGLKNAKYVAGSDIATIAAILSRLDEDLQKYVIDNILSKVCKETLLIIYVNMLTNYLTSKKYEQIDVVMKSFKLSGLIKDIELGEKKAAFQIQTLDDKLIQFNNALDTEEDIKFNYRNCHAATELALKQLSKENEIYGATLVMNNVFNTPYYHSVIVYNGTVNDFAKNIVMDFEDYKYLFGGKVIMMVEGKQLLRNIERLKERDVEFKNNKKCDVLNYAMHKQMKNIAKQ